MEKQLEILKEKYGTWQAVAKKLGITYRHICNIRSNNKSAGKSLQFMIRTLATQIKETE